MEKNVYHARGERSFRRALSDGRKRLRALPALDLPFLAILLLLVCLGLVVLFSAGYAVALYRRGDAYTYIRPQLLFAALGLAAMYLASLVDYHVWHKLAWPLMGVSLALLVVVLFMPEYNGCKRWIVLPGLGTLQPSEIAKFSVVLVFSHIISLNHDRMQTFSTGVLPFAVILGAVTVLMLLEPHLSGTLLILGIGAVLMFVGGTGLKWFGLAGAAAAAAIAAAVILLPELVPYAADRLASWQDPFADPLGEGHQTIQSLYAIASGGIAGLGLGNSRQKYLYVPEPQNDFIFSILCEELGFVGAAVVIGLFLLLLLRGMSIAVRARDRFGALLVVGFVVQVILQAVLNIAVVTNTIPNTGISLPFFSSGGTSLMMLLGEMGIVLSVSRQADAA
ncbi:MAG TPA: putative lipid II flippase FtsW [Candidatus Gemmiger faecigallinarum]|nr:putative lipid II flippase FtsW [Candidatus Gemmiger faecigallinarum]